MHIKLFTTAFLFLAFSATAYAQDAATHPADHQHGSEIWHMFTLETNYGDGEHGPVASWDLNGWVRAVKPFTATALA